MEEKRFFYVALLVTPFGTGTLIRTVTGFPYNHMGISFSPEMKNFYSFARYYKKQPFYAGFVKESVLRYNNNGKIAKIKVCAVPVTEENYQKAKEHVEFFINTSEEQIYNFISAVCFPFRKRVNVKNSLMCVEFVFDMLQKFTDIPEIKNKKFCSIKELSEILDCYKVYEGSVEKFFEGASWENDGFIEEKGWTFYVKKAAVTNAELFLRFIKREK